MGTNESIDKKPQRGLPEVLGTNHKISGRIDHLLLGCADDIDDEDFADADDLLEGNPDTMSDDKQDPQTLTFEANLESQGLLSPYASLSPDLEAELPFQKRIGISSAFKFQVDLASILESHNVDLNLFDEIIDLIKKYSNGSTLKFHSEGLKKREGFLSNIEKQMSPYPMEPLEEPVKFADGTYATVSVFDIEAMMMSLLHDDTLMNKANLAANLDIHTGKPINSELNEVYGEVHTGDRWAHARDYHCGNNPHNMPLGLIIFADKSHLDNYGALSTTPVIFTFTCFNESARNKAEFWRPLAYIPNLSHAKVTSRQTASKVAEANLQKEHDCLRKALEGLVALNKCGGFMTTVLGKHVVCKPWIHYIVGDTEGNNKMLGHFNGSGKLNMPWRDCKCSFDDLDNETPTCAYITRSEVKDAIEKMKSAETVSRRREIATHFSKHCIDNALLDPDLPLSYQEEGPYRMMPPEVLHICQEGISKYMIQSIKNALDSLPSGKKEVICSVEQLHQDIHTALTRNSDRDVPRGTDRSPLLGAVNLTATEVTGNLFRILCMTHTTFASDHFYPALSQVGIDVCNFRTCLTVYLAMEVWFHDTNSKEEVANANGVVGEVIELIKEAFPRESGHGWKLPKVHGLTKMVPSIRDFGSAINFFGGTGEHNHLAFVKRTGANTQKQVGSFACQIGRRWYESYLILMSKKLIEARCGDHGYQLVRKRKNSTRFTMNFGGRYILTIHGCYHPDGGIEFTTRDWETKRVTRKEKLPAKVLKTIMNHADQHHQCQPPIKVAAFTSIKKVIDSEQYTFRCTSNFLNRGSWYDWCLLNFNDHYTFGDICGHFPAQIMGVFTYNLGEDNAEDAHILCRISDTPLNMDELKENFFMPIYIPGGPRSPYSIVSREQIIAPLVVFPDFGGDVNQYKCALPRRHWGQYFSKKINEFRLCGSICSAPDSEI